MHHLSYIVRNLVALGQRVEVGWGEMSGTFRRNKMRPPIRRHTARENGIVSEPVEMGGLTSHPLCPMLPNPCSSQIEMGRTLAKQKQNHLIYK